jgi:hypothetical protein
MRINPENRSYALGGWRFGGTCRLHLRGSRISQVRKWREASNKHTFDIQRTTWRYILEHTALHNHRSVNLKLYVTSSAMICLRVSLSVSLFPRRSCCFRPRFLIPLLHFCCARCLFANFVPLRVPRIKPSNVRFFSVVSSRPSGPLWLCPLRGAGMARWVICRRKAANIFRDPSSPWVRFFCCRRRPTARCRSPYRSTSVPIVSTAASSLRTSCCSATVSDYRLASTPVVSTSSKSVLLSASLGSWLVSKLTSVFSQLPFIMAIICSTMVIERSIDSMIIRRGNHSPTMYTSIQSNNLVNPIQFCHDPTQFPIRSLLAQVVTCLSDYSRGLDW